MTKTAKIQINANEIGQAKINPYIFGHFVEDIRDHMDAMLAYELKDMDFEQEDNNKNGVSNPWYPITNGRNTVFALEPAAPKHTGHSQKIRIFNGDQCYGGIAQKISVRGGIDYNILLFARASLEIKSIILEIVDLKSQEKLCRTKIDLISHDWREYKGQFIAKRDCDEAEFRVFISSEGESWRDSVTTGMLWIDHLSILPEDSVGIVKKKVFDMTRELNAGIMRIGGNYISVYHWEYGVGTKYERPILLNEAWNTLACKEFGTDEFLDFCNKLEVAPHICVNDGSGTPEEAARWVEYCNGSKNTEMGEFRSKNGHPEPYDVKYWEIGNEVWGPWQAGHCTAQEFAERCVRFAKAMKVVDPSIIILACGHTDPDWNKSVLEIAGEYIDYLTLHIYHGYNHFGFINQNVTREDKYKAMVAYPEVTKQYLDNVRRGMGDYPHVKLAITEYNTMYYPNTIRKGLPNEHSLEAAVANAGNLNEFIRNCDMVEIGSFSDLVNGWLGGCIRVGDHYADQFRGKEPGWSGKSSVIYGTPTFYVMKMYANSDISYLVNCKVECDTFDVFSKNNKFQFENLPVLDVVSCINEEKNLLTIFVVNRSLEDIVVNISSQDFAFKGEAKVGIVTGNHIDQINDVFEPEAIICNNEHIEIGSHINYELKAHSVYAFEIKKQD